QITQRIDVIVAQDGPGNYTKISDAILAAPSFRRKPYYIKIKEGNYTEYVVVGREKTNLVLIGNGINNTIISGNKSHGKDHLSTYQTATVAIKGAGFVAMNITFENTAGPDQETGQAVALVSEVDSAFYRCKLDGYQDTLYAKSNKQFYRECDIYGTIDFIFGDASAVFQNCNIYVRFLGGNVKTITAEGREKPEGNGGIIIHNCTITAAEDFSENRTSIKTYMGRPWRNYSRTVILQTFLDEIIDPEGWLEWQGQSVDTIYYAEYNNRGRGSKTTGRVRWKGFRITKRLEAENFTVKKFISGNKWIPSTGIPIFPGLL
ncbi:hypothetical protein CISIN_1g042946mg, partial [Citrus sinensis]